MVKYLKLNFLLLLLLILIPFSTLDGFAQIQNEVTKSGTGGSGEGVFFVNTYPFSFKDGKGYTVVLGEILNNHNFPITDVKIRVNFYNDISNEPIDSVLGDTILDSIPALGTSPVIIKSSAPNSAISRVNMTLLSFDSSPVKPLSLSIITNSLKIGDSLSFSGIITNNDTMDATDIKIHLVSVDIFDPPRVVDISSINLDNSINPGKSQTFSINTTLNPKSVNYYILAESENYLSAKVNIDTKDISSESKIITLNDVTSTNIKQNNSIIFSPIRIDAQIFMQEFTSINSEEHYVFYVQIKEAESGLVEFIGKSSAVLYENSRENPNIIWIPENEGLFFIETYLWNTDDVTLSSPGEILIININTCLLYTSPSPRDS